MSGTSRLRWQSQESAAGRGIRMSVAEGRPPLDSEFAIEDMWLGVFADKVFASGFGQVGDGRSFAFRVEGQSLVVEVYRPRLSGPVPQPADVIATVRRDLGYVDITDERSLAAAVRDTFAVAEPIAS